jgi:ABC-type branched-subunit amino acid transport system ATPase component
MILALEGVHHCGKSHPAWRPIEVGVYEVVGLLGAGVGKSTTLKTISGTIGCGRCRRGRGRDIAGLAPPAGGAGIASPEDRRIFRLLTVLENRAPGSTVRTAQRRQGCSTRPAFRFPRAPPPGRWHARAASEDAGIARARCSSRKIILLDDR